MSQVEEEEVINSENTHSPTRGDSKYIYSFNPFDSPSPKQKNETLSEQEEEKEETREETHPGDVNHFQEEVEVEIVVESPKTPVSPIPPLTSPPSTLPDVLPPPLPTLTDDINNNDDINSVTKSTILSPFNPFLLDDDNEEKNNTHDAHDFEINTDNDDHDNDISDKDGELRLSDVAVADGNDLPVTTNDANVANVSSPFNPFQIDDDDGDGDNIETKNNANDAQIENNTNDDGTQNKNGADALNDTSKVIKKKKKKKKKKEEATDTTTDVAEGTMKKKSKKKPKDEKTMDAKDVVEGETIKKKSKKKKKEEVIDAANGVEEETNKKKSKKKKKEEVIDAANGIEEGPKKKKSKKKKQEEQTQDATIDVVEGTAKKKSKKKKKKEDGSETNNATVKASSTTKKNSIKSKKKKRDKNVYDDDSDSDDQLCQFFGGGGEGRHDTDNDNNITRPKKKTNTKKDKKTKTTTRKKTKKTKTKTNNNFTSAPRAYKMKALPSARTLGKRQTPNNGQLNSAHGEGTTVPQLLFRIRFVTFMHVIAVFFFEGFSIIGHIVTLNATRIVISCYLLFFVGLLCGFELLRGKPTVTARDKWSNLRSSRIGGLLGGGGNSNVNEEPAWASMSPVDEGIAVAGEAVNTAVETVWEITLEHKYARRIRFFLQSNFGILFSCSGRGLYCIFVGGLALGEGFIFMELTGLGFVLMGFWIISLGIKYPSLDKVFVMDSLEDEFGENRKSKDSWYLDDTPITWTNPDNAYNSFNHESQSLIAHS